MSKHDEINLEDMRAVIADDDPDILAMVADQLSSMDIDVMQVADGSDALKAVRSERPELVVLDVMMPGMSGWEVCRAIREDVSLNDVAVIMLTGIGERLNDMTSPLYGADAHLDKPFELDDFEQTVRQVIAEQRS